MGGKKKMICPGRGKGGENRIQKRDKRIKAWVEWLKGAGPIGYGYLSRRTR